MIETLGFQIKTKGDESVGIFSSTWELKPSKNGGLFQFEDENHYDGFLIDLNNTFRNHFDDEISIHPIAYMKDGKTMSEIWGDRAGKRRN